MLAKLSLTVFLSCFQLSRAINVYLHPPLDEISSSLSLEDTNTALSRHLGLEFFEPTRDSAQVVYKEEDFVGHGGHNVLLLTVDEIDATVVLPSSLRPAFTVDDKLSSSPLESLSSVISTYLHRASHNYDTIYKPSGATWQLEDVDVLSSFFDEADGSAFAALELTRLSNIRKTDGRSSEKYQQLAKQIRSFLGRIVDEPRYLNLAILTFHSPASNTNLKRQLKPVQSQSPLPPPSRPPPQQPIGSVSTCFNNVDTCTNSTNSCSGRGKCVEATKSGRTCFVCTCGVTKTGTGNQVKTETWVGDSCEKKDISGPFALLAGTVVIMIFLIFGSVSLLYGVGDQALPSTLLATAVTVKKD